MTRKIIIRFLIILISVCSFIFIARFTLNLCGYRIPVLEKFLDNIKIINQNEERSTASSDKNIQRTKGVQLELEGVSEEYKTVFNNNFEMIKKDFDNLTADRTDLQSAKMHYDAKNNRVEFLYYYTPNPNDIDTTSRTDLMLVNIVHYNLIGKTISSFFDKCKTDLKSLNVDIETPQIYIDYQVDEDNYLATYLPNQFQIIFGVKLPNKEMVEIKGSFASGTLTAGVAQPKKTVSGEYSSEYALIEFFNQSKSQTTSSLTLPQHQENEVTNNSSNGAGNLINGGLVCIQGDYIYYRNNDFKLYKSNLDGSNSIKLVDESASSITVLDNWIYYINQENKIYKIKTDGSNKTRLCDDSAASLYVSDNWVYYNEIIDGSIGNIFKINITGNNKTEISKDKASNIIVNGDWIYYMAYSDNGTVTGKYSLYKTKTDGTNKISLVDDGVITFNVIGDSIYYSTIHEIFKLKQDGSTKSLIYEGDDLGTNLNISGDWIYLYDLINSRIIKIRTDGTNKTALNINDYAMNINIAGDWIYYLKYEGRGGDNKYYKIKTDGTNRQLVK